MNTYINTTIVLKVHFSIKVNAAIYYFGIMGFNYIYYPIIYQATYRAVITRFVTKSLI